MVRYITNSKKEEVMVSKKELVLRAFRVKKLTECLLVLVSLCKPRGKDAGPEQSSDFQ